VEFRDESKFVENTSVRGNADLAHTDTEDAVAALVADDASRVDTEAADAEIAEEETNLQVGINSENEIPTRIENDMKFLNDSWANMMADGEAEIRLLKDLEKEHVDPDPNEGFQQVNRRKKKQKTTDVAQKTYDTRSKGVPSNPSQ